MVERVDSRLGGWSKAEAELLYRYFGDDTVLEIIERSPIEPQVVITWVEWYRLPPSIYVVDFRSRTQYDTPICEEVMSADEARSGKWGEYFPQAAPAQNGQ